MTTHPTLQTLGRRLLEARGERGIRAVAAEIGISHATLSRIERGLMPDLETFSKVCRWLGVDPGEVLRIKGREPEAGTETPVAAVHFRKDQALQPKTAQALAQLILAASRAMAVREKR